MERFKCFYSFIYMQYTVMKDLKTLWQSRLYGDALKHFFFGFSSEKLVAMVLQQPQFNDMDEETECQNWILCATI